LLSRVEWSSDDGRGQAKSIDRRARRRKSPASLSEREKQEDSVLIDHRTYSIKPGMVDAYLDLYEKYGLTAQTRQLGQPVAYMFAESGAINTIVHIWAYEDAADRMRKRASMAADPEWQNYLRLNAESGYLLQQRTSLMLPAKFAPIKR
jgi:NIPSNAP